MISQQIIVVVALSAALVACGYEPKGPAPERHPAEIATAATCRVPPSLDGIATQTPAVPPPRAGTIPDDFVPVAAITCDALPSHAIAADLTISFTEHRWEGDFTAATAKLNARSEGPRIDQSSCPMASLAAIPELWLIDAHGRAMRPSYPVDECNFRRVGGLHEVKSLTQTDQIDHRVQLPPEAVETLMGCSVTPPAPMPGPRTLTDGKFSVRNDVYRYRISFGGNQFAGALELDSSLDEAFATLASAATCSSPASGAVGTSLSPLSSEYSAPVPVLIELDGCRRVLIDGYLPLQASPELLDAVSEA